MKHYDFSELNNAADISLLQRISNNPKIIYFKGERELHDCCPFGGIADNTGFWINIDRHPMTWFCRRSCPGCTSGGDAMQFIAIREKLNRKTDAQKIAEILAAEIGATPSTPCNVSGNRTPTPFTKKKQILLNPVPPSKQWQQIAGDIVTRAAQTLHDPTNSEAAAALDYLHNRGISDKVIDRFKIGYLPIVPKYFGYWVNLADGKRYYRKLSDDEKKNAAKIPEGITIPTFIDGQLFRVKVRMMDHRAKEKADVYNQRAAAEAAAEGKPVQKIFTDHDFRYSYISGGEGTALFNADAAADTHPQHDIIFCEGELDALLLNSKVDSSYCGQLQAVTFGAAGTNPQYETYYQYFGKPKNIVIVFDNDDPGNAGAEKLQQAIAKVPRVNPAQIKKVPEYNGKYCKDFGDYYAAGGDISALLCTWFPD